MTDTFRGIPLRLRFLHRALKARFRDQPCEIKALTEALQPDSIAVDVGANKGSYLLWLSRAVPQGRVVAFEPQPRLADYLQRACAATGLTNVIVEAVGVSNQSGTMTLHIPGERDCPGASFEHAVELREDCHDVRVPTCSLADYFAHENRRIAAIKIDVEGHELSVFRGAERLLEEHAPILVFECESRHMTGGGVLTVLDYLRSRSFDGFFVHRSRLVPISEFKPDVHQAETGDRFWRSRDYCNNFVMRKVG
jgi:FkbM family methyltransferase